MRKFAVCLLSFAISLFSASCKPSSGGSNNSDGGDLKVNTYSVDGVVGTFNSVAVMMVGENISIVATPEQGVTSAEAILDSPNYLFASVSPLLVGKEFDIKTDSRLFTFISTLAEAPLSTVAPGETAEIVSGKALFLYENSILTVKAEMTLIDGALFKFHAQAGYSAVVNQNTIARGSEEKPLRAAFYSESGNTTTLVFTPANIEYYEELEDASWYMFITVSNNLANGTNIDVANLVESDTFEFGVVDNVRDSKSFSVVYGFTDMSRVAGSFNIAKRGDGKYAVNIDLTVSNVAYKANYDGECISEHKEQEVKTNYFVYNGKEYATTGATLTKGESVWSVEVSAANGMSAVVNAPQSFFEKGGAYGFSQSQLFTVVCEGVTYSKANGDSGTVTLQYDDQNRTLVIDFTNYDNLQFNYSGSVAVVE